MRKVRVEVGNSEILHGYKDNCNECPFALAFQKALNNPNIRVGRRYVWLRDLTTTKNFWGELESIPLPEEAINWITRFDRGYHVESITIELEVPDDYYCERQDLSNQQ